MSRHDLADEQSAVIEPFIPKQPSSRGHKRHDSCRTLNGIFFVLKTGCPWEHALRTDRSPAMCWRRFRHWATDRSWEQIWRTLLSQLQVQGKREWAQAFLDGSFVPAKTGYPALARPKSARAGRPWSWPMAKACR